MTATRARVNVAVVDRIGQVDNVSAYLPMRWATRRYETLDQVPGFDLLVLGGATPELVAAARLIHPDATVIAVIDAYAPVDLIVAILQAGADACVRAGASAVLAGHLMASHRRSLRRRRPTHLRAA